MSDKNFEAMDRSLMKDLKTAAKAPVPPDVLKGFSASVIEKIREEDPARETYHPVLSAVWLTPAFAVLILASLVVWHLPGGQEGKPLWQSAVSKPAAMIQLASTVSTISAEVAALRELGAWTDEDDLSSGAVEEDELPSV